MDRMQVIRKVYRDLKEMSATNALPAWAWPFIEAYAGGKYIECMKVYADNGGRAELDAAEVSSLEVYLTPAWKELIDQTYKKSEEYHDSYNNNYGYTEPQERKTAENWYHRFGERYAAKDYAACRKMIIDEYKLYDCHF